MVMQENEGLSGTDLLKRIQADYWILDQLTLVGDTGRVLCADPLPDERAIRLRPGPFVRLFRRMGPVFSLLFAWQQLAACGRDGLLVTNGGSSNWIFVGILNRLLFAGRKKVLCWDIFIESENVRKKKVLCYAMSGNTLSILWSRKQIEPHVEFTGLPPHRFLYLPYKANHSKQPTFTVPEGSFVFAGGNGKRDYVTLAEAVRGTEIPVIISATDPAVRARIPRLPNVVILGASEPDFGKLQAMSRFIVLPMINTGLKGGGEANFCNAGWHGKPVIGVDAMAAYEYIIDGETGFVVEPGDVETLRKRMLQLWNDPELCRSMGQKARRHVEANFTHDRFHERFFKLAAILAGGQTRLSPAGDGGNAGTEENR